MVKLGTARTGLDSFVYWATFIVLSSFVTFFLNGMVELANAEQHQYDTAARLDTAKMHERIKSNHIAGTTSTDDVMADDSGY